MQIHSKNKELEETVARMTQIPDVPFGFRLHSVILDQSNTDNLKILYHPKKSAKIDLEYLKKDYMTTMETLGWDFINQFESQHEFLLNFVKPGNIWCQVRFDQNNMLTVWLVSEKKDRF